MAAVRKLTVADWLCIVFLAVACCVFAAAFVRYVLSPAAKTLVVSPQATSDHRGP